MSIEELIKETNGRINSLDNDTKKCLIKDLLGLWHDVKTHVKYEYLNDEHLIIMNIMRRRKIDSYGFEVVSRLIARYDEEKIIDLYKSYFPQA